MSGAGPTRATQVATGPCARIPLAGLANRKKGDDVSYDPGASFVGLHHVQLAIPTGAEDKCREFWGDILGFEELEKPPVLAARGGCWFRGGGFEVHLGVENDFRPAAKAHPGILMKGLESVADHLQEKGIDVEWDQNFPGMRRFYAFDLLGNRLEFLEPIA